MMVISKGIPAKCIKCINSGLGNIDKYSDLPSFTERCETLRFQCGFHSIDSRWLFFEECLHDSHSEHLLSQELQRGENCI